MRGYFGLGQLSATEKSDILDQHKSLYNGYQTMHPQVSNTQPLTVYDFAGDKEGLVVNNKGEVKRYTNVGINEQVEESKEVCDECGAMGMSEGECLECGWKGEVGAMEEQDEDPQHHRIHRRSGKFKKHQYTESEEACNECGGMMSEGECSECGWKGDMDEEKGHLDDIYDEEDLNPNAEFDYVKGASNKTNAFHLKEDDGDDFVNYNDNFEDPDNEDDGFEDINASEVTDEVEEQGYTGGGNAPDMDLSNIDPAYDFVSDGPMAGGDVYPTEGEIDEEWKEWEQMESAWSDDVMGDMDDGEELYPTFSKDEFVGMSKKSDDMDDKWKEIDEIDISGAQGVYGDMDPAYDFDSEGPGKAGPYQRSSWSEGSMNDNKIEHGYEGEDEDAYWEKDLADDELDLDLTKFNPEDKSWEEISAYTGDDEFSYLDEDIRESVINQKNKIMEMMNRMKVIK